MYSTTPLNLFKNAFGVGVGSRAQGVTCKALWAPVNTSDNAKSSARNQGSACEPDLMCMQHLNRPQQWFYGFVLYTSIIPPCTADI